MAKGTVLDASLFVGADANPQSRLQFSRQLVQGILTDGYVRLVNHGVSSRLLRESFDWNRRFFNLPESIKNSIEHTPGPNPQRGYSSLGSEKTSRVYAKLIGREVSDTQRDAREHFDYGAADDIEFANVFPPESNLPGFRQDMDKLYDSCATASYFILAALELGLGIPTGTFLQLCKRGPNASEARLNHYPAISLDEVQQQGGDASRISPHFDLGVLTLLFSDGVGGLEFEDRRIPGHEAFVPVETSSPDEMIVSVAETMQRWTGDKVPASLHRVTIPTQTQQEGFFRPRYSIVYLCKAVRDADVGVLPEFRESGREPKYESMTALQYHKQRIAAAY